MIYTSLIIFLIYDIFDIEMVVWHLLDDTTGWIAAGTAASLQSTLETVNEKYKNKGAALAATSAAIRAAFEAAADDEDPEDVFVRLDENGTVGEGFFSSEAAGKMEEGDDGIPESKHHE